jgi:hypothetical protein
LGLCCNEGAAVWCTVIDFAHAGGDELLKMFANSETLATFPTFLKLIIASIYAQHHAFHRCTCIY